MSNLNRLISKHTIGHDRRVKRICSPLEEKLQIPIFTYYFIDAEGDYGTLSTCPKQLEFYYSNELYHENPFLRDPQKLRTGQLLIQAIHDPEYLEVSKKRFEVGDLLLITKKNGSTLEGFLFGKPVLEVSDIQVFLDNLDKLHLFASYFKREAKDLIQKMKEERYSLKEAKGDHFFAEDRNCALSSKNSQFLQFQAATSPLSKRELECLELYKLGHSAQNVAGILGLSQRTVEHYYDSIKCKLGCSTKRDLLSF